MLTNDEIIRRLRIIKHSSISSRQSGPSISAIAHHAGITRAAIYLMLQTGSTGRSRARLSDAFELPCKECQDIDGARPADHSAR